MDYNNYNRKFDNKFLENSSNVFMTKDLGYMDSLMSGPSLIERIKNTQKSKLKFPSIKTDMTVRQSLQNTNSVKEIIWNSKKQKSFSMKKLTLSPNIDKRPLSLKLDTKNSMTNRLELVKIKDGLTFRLDRTRQQSNECSILKTTRNS